MTMNEAIAALLENIVADYAKFQNWLNRDAAEARVQKFRDAFEVIDGKKYIKIVKEGSVWGFIVKQDDGKFRAGDILKAASWATPAKNAARGNIFGNYSVAWTGPHYLR